MGRRGRKPMQIKIEVGMNEEHFRFGSLMDALTAALPDLVEAIARCESSVAITPRSEIGTNEPHPDNPQTDQEQHDLKA